MDESTETRGAVPDKTDETAGQISRRTALRKGGFALGGSIVGLSSLAGTALAEPTEIDECTTIDHGESGRYVLADDLSATGDCLTIRAPDVTIDGNGHTISGDGTGVGISLGLGVELRDLTVENFGTGIGSLGVIDGKISLENAVVSDNAERGISLAYRKDLEALNSAIRDNGTAGVSLAEGSQVLVDGSTIRGNGGSAMTSNYVSVVEVRDSAVSENGDGITAGMGEVVESTIENNGGDGIRMIGSTMSSNPGTASIVGNDIRGNAGAGVNFVFSSGTVRENTIANNENGLFVQEHRDRYSPTWEFTKNNIEGNDAFGVRNRDDRTVVAPCNYWGHETGPGRGGDSAGDEVSDNVAFRPWSVTRIRDGEGTCVGGSETSDSALSPVGDFENSPTDLDGNGAFEDVNGDGEFDSVDVQALFANRDDPTIQDDPEKFDFNGDSTFDVVDVQALFAELVGRN